ncbi:universal stress protein [Acidiferrimicrobium sp. IK]|uniref:universal stress protein n=1 Tax=Acidiferrimicrobium sp. IK TaxID=2871700 RepID=UPI0021CB18B9|nr:universal stress protein [Acidiferrimicrobium sp. IK]MCU4182861.1 universal stress protein [Acidiferrimicrobium sp. IK]
MTATTGGDSLVVGVDGSPSSEDALGWACHEAVRRPAEVLAVFVAPAYVDLDPDTLGPAVTGEGNRALAEARAATTTAVVHRLVRCGPAAPVLRMLAVRRGAAMLVVGRGGASGLGRLVVGSVSDALAQDPPQPLAVVPAGYANAARAKVAVVGVDGSAHADAALRWAATRAAATASRVRAVLARDGGDRHRPPPDARLDAVLAGLDPALRALVDPAVVQGTPADALCHAAGDADLLVVGTRGLGPLRRRVLGSTSRAVLHGCRVPLVIVPSAVTPDADRSSALAGRDATGTGVSR